MRLVPRPLIREIETNHAHILAELAEIPLDAAILVLELRILAEAQRVLGARTGMDGTLRAMPADLERRVYSLTNLYAHLQTYPSHGTSYAKRRRLQEYRWFRLGLAG